MSENPAALARLVKEFTEAELDARNSGIYAAKTGYHNTRAHHLAGTHGGKTSDYSIKLAVDKKGPADKAAAVDISFDSARLQGDFSVIGVYSRRLDAACRARDPRLFVGGQSVIREWFGNTDKDRDVEGWTFHRTTDGSSGPASSDSSHLWHIHISFHRAFVEDWDAVSGVLDVLLARPRPTPAPEDDMANASEVLEAIADLRAYVKETYEDTTAKLNKFEERERGRDADERAAVARVEAVAKQLDDKIQQIIGGQS
jgi:hypothetical protein